MNASFTNLMNKEVSRGEFLGMAGLAAASVFGFGTLLKLLTGKSLEGYDAANLDGYGGSVYGGIRR